MQRQEYGKPISLADAKKAAGAAEAEAIANNWAMVIAIVDSSGHLVVLHRMDDAQFGSLAVAQAKARTAVSFKRPSKVFEDALAAGNVNLRLLSTEGVCPIEGGVLLVRNSAIIRAIGVSGALPPQDGQVAEAGARAITLEALRQGTRA